MSPKVCDEFCAKSSEECKTYIFNGTLQYYGEFFNYISNPMKYRGLVGVGAVGA